MKHLAPEARAARERPPLRVAATTGCFHAFSALQACLSLLFLLPPYLVFLETERSDS
jgi:hypothetical protein